ncbi:putative oxidoreductase [Lachnellula occidentalis]|uniref:Putative oxidoreductase n=1 Tax=Lachnellula occidentalis TaxID=215460 RepID=A0A8H8S335_9HELO|nr:putative oxidoreductase [Lachnellula occidentalis]
MTATKIPVGLPVRNPTNSYWQTPPHPLKDHRTTPNLPSSSQYVIVGSGVTGASIAHKLLLSHPTAQITILEARTAASGASGRNGGHCRGGRYLEFKNYAERFGKDDALKMDQWEEDNVKNVGVFIREHGIECDLRDVESVDVTTDDGQFQDILEALKMRKEVAGKAGVALWEHKIWSQEEARKELLIPQAVGAVSFPAHVLNPYRFVCALLEMSLEKGMNLQTNTPVVEVAKQHSGKKWIVSTERGDVEADRVILATNAYTSALYPPVADFIIPTRGQIAAIRPGSNIAGNPALKRTCEMSDGTSGDYFQSRQKPFTGAGDLIMGGGRRVSPTGEQPILDDSTIHPAISSYLVKTVPPKYFGRENWGEDGEVVMEWTGIMAYTKDQQPIIGQAPGQDGLWICAGFNGHGMALTFQAAEALVGLLTGREAEVEKWLPDCFKIARVPRIR